MVVINIGIGTDKRAVSRLAITLDDSYTDAISCEAVSSEVHAMLWRYLQSWAKRGVAITIKTEIVE